MLMLRAMAQLSPDAAILAITMGVVLIYVELNRPGWIVSGAVGLLAVLFGVASLLRMELNAGAVVLVGSAMAVLAVGLRRRTTALVAAAATVALVLGLGQLVAGPGAERVDPLAALAGGVVIGAGTSILTRIARRARTNKGLD